MFKKKYDVVVAGGGIAGVAAALASTRQGMKTILLEKTVNTGGLATNGMILYYLPLCDGHGHQVSFGITDELLKIANEYGPADIPDTWETEDGVRLRAYFSPASFVLSMDKLLLNSGVDIWFDTIVCGANVEDDNLKSINVYNKSGFGEIEADVFIDATGDSDVAFLAGNEYISSANSIAIWTIEHRESENSSIFTFGENNSTLKYTKSLNNPTTEVGINGKIVSDFLLESRKIYREILDDDYAKNIETRKTRYPLTLPTMVPLRKTRCIKAKHILQPNMEWQSVEDSVGLAADWRCAGKVWEIPYASMIPNKIKNLIAAGRCTSAVGDAWEITRVIPVAAMTGEVAGIAAALSLKNSCQVDKLEYKILAKELRKQGFILNFNEIKK